ncbi:MAG: YitT family protein [Prevotella sp.]|nr:YitT family protein [Prevotella sp.]MDE6011511.1 YitT family protein [Prevotella sp.]MDE6689575.1 YitT family protein [Prevotella sp.]MDE7089336.1 YitT family protein [Prevotella sp.]
MGKTTKAFVLNELKDYVMITIAMISYCIGWNVFLLPNNISTGGVAGVSSILFWGTGIPAQIYYFAINAVLLIAALHILGWKFCVKTVYAVIALTVASTVATQLYHEHWLSDQPFMAAIIGAVFCGSGVGLVLANNGSTGGTDIIAAIVNKYREISLGRVILICDVFIISSSYLVLRDFERVLYGYVVLYVTAFCIDWVINSMRSSVQFFIISDKYEEIGERINHEPHRGCTVIDAHGFYSGKEVKMLFVLANKRQSDIIFRLINEVDPHAFVSQSAVIGVYGEGFNRFKMRRKSPKSPTDAITTS